MTTAGDLRHRIRLDRRVKVENSRGEVTYTWVPHATVWAQARPVKPRQRGAVTFAAGQVHSEITTIFRVRYRTGLDETMRVIWRDAIYDIKAPPAEFNGLREWIDLLCIEGVVADGR